MFAGTRRNVPLMHLLVQLYDGGFICQRVQCSTISRCVARNVEGALTTKATRANFTNSCGTAREWPRSALRFRLRPAAPRRLNRVRLRSNVQPFMPIWRAISAHSVRDLPFDCLIAFTSSLFMSARVVNRFSLQGSGGPALFCHQL